jgi:hypothetical protein
MHNKRVLRRSHTRNRLLPHDAILSINVLLFSTYTRGEKTLTEEIRPVIEIRQKLESIENKDYRRKTLAVLEAVLKDGFDTKPAALRNHHAYEFGLAIHTNETMDFALTLYNAVSNCVFTRDDVIIAAFAHDLGKTYAFYKTPDGAFKYGEAQISQEAKVIQLFAAQDFVLPEPIISACEWAHGGWSDLAQSKHSIRPHPLFVIIHAADLMSAWGYSNPNETGRRK